MRTGAGEGARLCGVMLELVAGLPVAAGVAALAVHIGGLFHRFAGGAAIFAGADGAGTDGVSAFVGFVGHGISLCGEPRPGGGPVEIWCGGGL